MLVDTKVVCSRRGTNEKPDQKGVVFKRLSFQSPSNVPLLLVFRNDDDDARFEEQKRRRRWVVVVVVVVVVGRRRRLRRLLNTQSVSHQSFRIGKNALLLEIF